MKMKKKDRFVKRPCSDCAYFRMLAGRFGVCRMGEHPNDPKVCKVFRVRVA